MIKEKINTLVKGIALVSSFVFSQADHVVFTEVVLTPSDGEYVEITNPTEVEVDLSDYYLTDATDNSSGKFYYKLPSNTDYWSGLGNDFICRFPDNYLLPAGASIKISLRDSDSYQNTYGELPDLSLDNEMLNAVDGGSTKGSAAAPKLGNANETLVLFYWDGSSSIVKDVDYLLWGDNSFAVDKSDVSGYQSDTPVLSQSYMSSHATNEKLIRATISNEGSEAESGGNGITGHDETSEPLSDTWVIASLISSKPDISNLSLTPSSPTTEEILVFEVTVTDDEGVSAVNLKYEFQGEDVSVSMSETSSSVYTAQIGPLGESGSLIYSVIAEDISGLKDSTSKVAVMISEPPEELTIASLIENFDSYIGKEVEIKGVVTVPSGILRTNRVQVFVQDASGQGILLDQSGETLNKGDSVQVNGTLSVYVGTESVPTLQPQLINSTISVLKTDAQIPLLTISSINKFNQFIEIINPEDSNSYQVLKYMNTYVKFDGRVVSRVDNLGGGSNITLQGIDGAFTTVRIWNSTNVLFNSVGDSVVNDRIDSLLNVGNDIEVSGIAGQYNGEGQILPAYETDINEKLEGQIGDYTASLTVSPYPFVPQLGEKIKYRFEFPSDARIKLRVFDTSGRLITTLYDEYRGISYLKDDYWNGRDNLNRLVPSGTYIIHLDVVDAKTGKSFQKMAPVVIATYKN